QRDAQQCCVLHAQDGNGPFEQMTADTKPQLVDAVLKHLGVSASCSVSEPIEECHFPLLAVVQGEQHLTRSANSPEWNNRSYDLQNRAANNQVEAVASGAALLFEAFYQTGIASPHCRTELLCLIVCDDHSLRCNKRANGNEDKPNKYQNRSADHIARSHLTL